MKKLILLTLILFSTLVQADLRRGDGADVPPGTTINFAGASCPTGFLKADGGAVSRTTYSKLFAAINTLYGAGNGNTTFNLPNSTWFIDANLGGPANVNSSGVSSSYIPMTSTNLNLIINSSKGSSNAELSCASGTSSSGLTCPANSNIGIAFIPHKYSGRYKVCMDFSANIDNTTGSANVATNATFQLMETPNNSTIVLQQGGARLWNYMYHVNLGTGGISGHYPNSLCGNFVFTDMNKKTIRLMYTSSALNPSLLIITDRSSIDGLRDVRITVEPYDVIGNCIKY